MIRKLVLFFCAAAALVAAPGAVRAETDVGFAFYEKTAVTVLKSAGAKIWGAADDARKCGLFQFAAEQAERALEFDPNLEDARKYLGFVKKGDKWVADPEATEKVARQNVRPQNRSDAAQAQLQKKWEDESLKAADRFCAKLYADLGDVCAAKGYADQALKGYESALRLDKDNASARKGLGYTKFGKTWITKKQDDARKAAAKAEVIKDTESTVFEDLFEKKLNKVESMHFRFESPYDVPELKMYAEAAETAYAYYLADFEHDPTEDVLEGHRMLFVVMQDDAQWNKFVDRFAGNDKEFTRKLAGCHVGNGMGVRSQQGSTMESRRDMIVHQAVHRLGDRMWRIGDRAWLNEGLAYYYTLKVLESCLTHCVAQKKGDYANGHKDEGGMKDWGDPANWKPLMKTSVQKKDDTALRTVIMVPLTKLDFQDTVKSWSVITYLMDLDRSKFIQMLDQMLDPAVKQENVIQGVWGKGLEDLDEDWHAHVKKTY